MISFLCVLSLSWYEIGCRQRCDCNFSVFYGLAGWYGIGCRQRCDCDFISLCFMARLAGTG